MAILKKKEKKKNLSIARSASDPISAIRKMSSNLSAAYTRARLNSN